MKYLVKASAATALRLSEPRRLPFENVDIGLSNREVDDGGGPVHQGVLFDIVLEAESLDGALDLAEGYLDGIASTLAYADSIAVGPVDTLVAYEYGPGELDRRAVQKIDLGLAARPIRLHRADQHNRVLGALLSKTEERSRIERGIAWYRKGLASIYTPDAFQAYWTALEALNPPLERKHGLQNVRVIRECPSCHAPVVTFPTNNGAKLVVTRIGGDELWRELNRLRQDLMHSRESISKFVPRARELLPRLADCVFEAIKDALDIEAVADLRRGPMRVAPTHSAKVRFTLRSAKETQLPWGSAFPRIRVERVGAAARDLTGTTITEKAAVRFNIDDYAGEWSVENLDTTLHGDPDRPAPKFELTDPVVVKADGDKR